MAFIPIKTFSGASFPILNTTVEGAVTAGDLLKAHGTDNQWTKVTDASDDGPLAVALNTAADEKACAICICTPDVIFQTTATTGTILTGTSLGLDVTNMCIVNATAENSIIDIRIVVLDSFVDFAGTTKYNVLIYSASAAT